MQSAIGPHTVDFLLSERGRGAAAELAAGDPTNLQDERLAPLLDKLRRRYTPAEAGALVTLARLRRRAAVKFPQAEHLFFTAEALEQATTFDIAAEHARWLDRHTPPGPLLDLGCGIGGDLLALAQRRRVIAYELDEVRARFAQANSEALGLAQQVEVRIRDWVADMHAGALPPAAGAFADPARRREEQRIFHLDQMQPPISALLVLQQQTPALGVKVMPGVADAELPAGCGVEFISHDGVCKEAVLWFGPTRWRTKWATLFERVQCGEYGGPRPARSLAADSAGDPPPLGPLVAGHVLYEPDCALIRAGYLADLCRRLGAHLFDPEIAYLVGDRLEDTSLAQAFLIEEVHPFSLKLLNARLQTLGVARVELKKRGFPQEPESLRPRLKLQREGRNAVVLFTRRGNEHMMILARRAAPKG